MLYYLLFSFLAVGAKLLLALAMIFWLLPGDRNCNQCDNETLLLQMSRGHRWMSRLCVGRLQRRWCPRCGWEGYARAISLGSLRPASLRSRAPRPDDAREFLN
jgi:hypothetical protein